MIKEFTLTKGTKVKVINHDWSGWSENYIEKVIELDRDLTVRSRTVDIAKEKMKYLIRKTYGLRNTSYNKHIVKVNDFSIFQDK